jgi:hypothetical protein
MYHVVTFHHTHSYMHNYLNHLLHVNAAHSLSLTQHIPFKKQNNFKKEKKQCAEPTNTAPYRHDTPAIPP